MLTVKNYSFWFVTGSQHLYGDETLREINEHTQKMVEGFNEDHEITYSIEWKPVVTTPEEIRNILQAANNDENCAGVITWMHTFSPAKMWIAGLKILNKPLLHLHTQFNRDIPWDKIDMDFMNTNQSAHGDREFGFMVSRLGISRKVVAGHWESADVRGRMNQWMGTAVAGIESENLKVARFGDNMREVAVTEGDKVEAQIRYGWSVNGYGIGDLVSRIRDVSDAEARQLLDEYQEQYTIVTSNLDSVKEQARIELGMKSFLQEGGFGAFTTTFEDLHGMKQLPGLAVQRLMAEGYGFGGEGDWKTAALVRLMKIMANNKRTSFMEDYTYHFEPGNESILGSHMLEICPTIAVDKPKIAVHPLGIGGKEDPARLIFNGQTGKAVVASVVDMGTGFRLVVNEIEAIDSKEEMPNLPVASVLWKPEPSLSEAAEAWIYAGGSHHSSLSFIVTAEQLYDWAEMTDTEYILINKDTSMLSLRKELRNSSLILR